MAPALSHFQARPLLAARGAKARASSSCDLGLTRQEVALSDEGAAFDFGVVSWDQLEAIAEDQNKVFVLLEGEWREARVFSESTGMVRTLRPTRGAPTTLVSGFPMHRIKDTDPWADSRAKLQALGPIKGRVLDACTGLGYTAILASRRAKEVVSLEVDPAALEIARLNPWSADLFQSGKITLVVADAGDYAHECPPASFEGIIHDPPSISLAGNLYSEGLYRQFRRILSPRGALFHYVGDPETSLGARTTEGVIRRLHDAGFRKVERCPEAFGVTAR